MALEITKKNLENTQFGRVCTDTSQPGGPGNRHGGNATMDDGLEPLLDDNGRIIVRIANSGGFIEDSTIDFSSGAVYTNERVLTGIVERNLVINGYSDLPVPAYIQIIDSVVIPILGAIPFIVFPVAAGPGAFFKPFNLANGQADSYYIVISSTQFSFTPIATPCLYVWGTVVQP